MFSFWQCYITQIGFIAEGDFELLLDLLGFMSPVLVLQEWTTVPTLCSTALLMRSKYSTSLQPGSDEFIRIS